MGDDFARWARHFETLAAVAVAGAVIVSAIDRASSHTLGARIAAGWRQNARPRLTGRVPSPLEVSAVLSEAQRYTREAAGDG